MALGVTAILFLAALSMLSLDHRVYNRDDAVLEAAREGRYAVDKLERDMLMLGYQVDVRTIADNGPDGTASTDDDIVGQPQIAFAAPYEIVFNADVDPNIDAIHDGQASDATPTGYAPVTFHTGAETVRYTLDSTGDGTIDSSDLGDEPDEAVIENKGLYLLRRETYGYNGTNNTNAAGPVALVRGPVAYPNGSQAIPLFLYWGDFDSDPAEDLWGDDGSGGGTAGNGMLEPGELAALGPVTDEDADNDAVLDAGEDRNGNGTLERRVTELIRRVEIHVTTETSYPDMDYTDPTRSSSSVPFRFRTVTTNTEIKPRNIELPGGACGDTPEKTSSPSIVNACPSSLADGKVTVSWSLSPDDGNFEDDIEKYLIWRTDVNSVFGPTPFDEVIDGTSNWEDDWIEMRTWPPRQYWYRVRAMDCTPQLSRLDPIAGPYPPTPGAAYPTTFSVADIAGDDGTNLRVDWAASPDDPANTSGFGGDVKKYYVYRSTAPDYRCVAPVNSSVITASGAPTYSFTDNNSNSTSAIAFGQLYYYWMRAMDDSTVLSPYSPRACARAYEGPALPLSPQMRVANYGTSDHPVEAWVLPNRANDAAGYDPYLVEYRLYHSQDLNSDGTLDSMLDIPVGYTDSQLETSRSWDGIYWAVGTGGTADIHHGITAGATPRALNNPTSNILESVDFVDRLNGVTVGASGTILTTHDGGISWSGTPGTYTAAALKGVDMTSSLVGVTVGATGTILRSEDGGDTWSTVTSPVLDDLNAVAGSEAFIVAVGDNGTVLTSADSGQTFGQNLTFPGPDPNYSVCVANGGTGSKMIYVGSVDKVYVSADSGGTWSPKDFTGEGRITAISCLDSGQVMFGAYDNNTVFSSGDQGTTWSQEPIAPDRPLALRMISPRLAWVGTSSGDLIYRDHNGAWLSVTIDAGLEIRGLAARPEIVFEVSSTANDPSGTPYYGVITTRYAQGGALDGEAGKTPDQPASIESPDDNLEQIPVDSCNSFELSAIQP